ncbi:dGTP triphosphohydrolase [Microbacterium marinum]|uniref:dGTP triphosphohydrolase n=1 Tax=Microbacterium marinum TaxID=421115 RepID=A0A7W7BQN1_9MICO|nr:hypothetical protein [Microbacterium marinum]MBB4667060.1 dGTP triphosphohydrolase [Microbacterium marinum]
MSDYTDARDHYWTAQRDFREAAVAEMERQMTEGIHAVILEINDTPRLAVADLLDADGKSVMHDADGEEHPQWDVLDSIAADMEVFTWDEGDSFLFRHDGGGRFIIEREA